MSQKRERNVRKRDRGQKNSFGAETIDSEDFFISVFSSNVG